MEKSVHPSPPELRLLLDQGFPKPSGFTMQSVDRTTEVIHLSDFDSSLSEQSTPDWALYCIAAEAGFDALVTRDAAQLEQSTEMYALSRLGGFSVVTWRIPIEDPVREWGQLLAYLPALKRRICSTGWGGGAIRLPAPRLSAENEWRPRDQLGRRASDLGVSQSEVRSSARRDVRRWCEERYGDAGRFDDLLAHGRRPPRA